LKALTVFCLFVLSFAYFCSAKVIVVGKLTHEQNLPPGQPFDGTIVLENTAESDAEVRVYQTDYWFTADGLSRYDPPGTISRSNATWLSLSDEYITIPAGQRFPLFYQGNVPSDTSLSGTYWSMIMVEPVSDFSYDTIADADHRVRMGITTKTRYGIQVITNIGNEAEPVLEFINKDLKQTPGGPVLIIDVANTGSKVTRPKAWLEIYDGDANLIARFISKPTRIYPDCSVRHRFNLTGIENGSYRALVILDDGTTCAYGAQYDLVIQ